MRMFLLREDGHQGIRVDHNQGLICVLFGFSDAIFQNCHAKVWPLANLQWSRNSICGVGVVKIKGTLSNSFRSKPGTN